jgi:hypothetical protein
MAPGKLYLVPASGGAPNFASNGELRTVELPASFQFPALKGKTLVDQVNCIFAARMRWLESQLPTEVLREYALLDKAVRSESEIDELIRLRQARERHKVARPVGRTE